MPGKYGAQSIAISYDDAPGGTLQVVTGYIQTMSGVKIVSAQQLSHAFGDSAEETTPSGMTKVEPFTLTGLWDTTATTGPHVVFLTPDDGPQDATRSLRIVFGDSKQFDVETRLVSYSVLGKNGALSEFEAVIQPTGAHTWA